MKKLIQGVIDEWTAERGPYSYELRFHPYLNPSQVSSNSPFVELVFIIIDVRGFFLDIEHTQPIKLHHERVISIDRYNTDQQYAQDLRKDLNLLTKAAYAEFEKILKSLPQPICTTDPSFMKF